MDTVELFSDSKRRLLERFLRGAAARQSWELPIPARSPGDSTPLAPAQQHLLLHAQMAPDSPLYNESVTVYFRGELDRSAFERAFHEILRRHEIWRTGFVTVGGETVQAVYSEYKLEIPFNDLTHLPEAARESEALRLASADVKRSMDLAVGPLLRARLVRLAKDDYRCYIAIHHLIHDGVAVYDVFYPELVAIYEAFSKGLPSPLAEPELQYGDFAVWQKQLHDNEVVDRQMEYWRGTLAGELPQLELPTDRSRPAVLSYAGGIERSSLSQETTESLRSLSRDEGVTFYMLLVAAFNGLLFRYTGQEDILVGGLNDGRRRTEFQRLMGYFLNALPLRTKPSGNVVFREYLASVKEVVLGSMANSDVLFDRMVREIQPQRDPSRHPLFQTMFVMEPPPAPAIDPRWNLKQGEVSSGTAKFDLLCDVEDRPEGLAIRMHYRSDLFDAFTIRKMIGHWQVMLEGIAKAPATLVGDLPLLASDERKLLVDTWNDTRRPVRHATIHRMFEERAARHPNAVAVESDGHWLTYAELNQEANRLARRLRQAGAGPETLVGLCVNRGCDMIVAVLAVLKSGAAYLPLDPALPEERLRVIVEDSEAPILLLERPLEDKLAALPAVRVFTDEAFGTSDNLEALASPDNLAYVLYTSGTTGGPKGVEVLHSGLVNYIDALKLVHAVTAADRTLSVTTLSFDIATMDIFLPLVNGGRLVIASYEDARDPGRLLELMAEAVPTVMNATPAMWRALIDAGWKGDRNLRIMSGGDALTSDLALDLLDRCAVLWNGYGPTETTIGSAFQRVTAETLQSGRVPIGKPIANTQLYVLDQRQKLVPVGVAGELYIGGAGLARGYFRRPELTRSRFVEVPGLGRLFRTGDLVRWLSNGTLECLGRTDRQLKIRGFRIEPEEIEAALQQHPEVRAAAVKAWPDASGNLSLTAYVVSTGRPGVRAFLDKKLPDYMIPSRVMWLDEMPLTASGKVDRRRLPEPDIDESRPLPATAANGTERRLMNIWESVLARQNIGATDNFFDLGGHSLLVAKLLRRVEAEFSVRFNMADVFQAPTIRQFAEQLSRRNISSSSRQLINIKGPAAPASREEFKQRLTATWERVLGRKNVGVDANFFELCGPAPLASQLLQAMQEEFGEQLTMADVSQAPTIEKLAVLLQASRSQPAVITFQDKGSRPPIYWIDPGPWTRTLATHMGTQRPFLGVGLSSEFDALLPENASLPEIAACVVRTLRTLQPEGPYILGGWCASGLLAYAVARQLSESGNDVPLLVMLDGYNPARLFAAPRRTQLGGRARYHLKNLVAGSLRDGVQYAAKRVTALLGRFRAVQQRERRLMQGFFNYNPPSYNGRVLLLEADVTPAGYSLAETWDGILTGHVEVARMPGNHMSVLMEPHIGAVADRINASLDAAETVHHRRVANQ